jgi:hypothetical protein
MHELPITAAMLDGEVKGISPQSDTPLYSAKGKPAENLEKDGGLRGAKGRPVDEKDSEGLALPVRRRAKVRERTKRLNASLTGRGSSLRGSGETNLSPGALRGIRVWMVSEQNPGAAVLHGTAGSPRLVRCQPT